MLYAGGIVLGEEAMPQFYRRVNLNGRPSSDTEPYLHKRSDAEPELSCVDGLTLQLRHDTTDVYVPLVAGEFALQVRRSHMGAVWSSGRGMPSCKRPDLPFGNCWLSGIAANVHVMDLGNGLPVHVLVTDEQGTLHRFIELFRQGQHAGYYPLPGCHYLQDGRTMSLICQGNRLEFKRKYGTALSFEIDAPAVETATGLDGNIEEHRYYRAVRVNDRCGGYTQYHFEEGNGSLIPDTLSFGKLGITIHRNQEGVVERIVDTRGHEHRYEYRSSQFSDGSPLLVRVYRPMLEAAAPCTSYEYEEVNQAIGPDVEERHAALSSIADPLDNTYTFKYRHHFAAPGAIGATPSGREHIQPIRVSEVGLPDKKSVTNFHDYSASSASLLPGPRTIFVSDSERNGLLLEFEEPQAIELQDLPCVRATGTQGGPRLAVWRRFQVSYFQGHRHRFDEKKGQFHPGFFTRRLLMERYEFDMGAGMALSRAIDTEGNITSFVHADKLDRRPLENILPKQLQDPLAERHRDVTESINPLGGTKRFVYDASTRAVVRKEDELGHLTLIESAPGTGLPIFEIVYADSKAEHARTPFARTDYVYANADFPGFLTRKTVRRISSDESPSWEVDLVRVYEADELGRVVREVADPEDAHFEWIFAHDEAANKISAQHPNGAIYQFRYDPLNRLVRVYQPNGGVKKFRYDARGNKITEIEPNGDTTTMEYDSFARLIRTVVETGPIDQRRKGITVTRFNAVGSKLYEQQPSKPSKTHKYDGLQRVISVRVGRKMANLEYAYSANGCSNLFRSSRFCPAFNLVERRSRWHFQYDGLQNCVKKGHGFYRFSAFFSKSKHLVLQKFDSAGNLIERKNWQGTSRYEYDPLNRLVTEHLAGGGWKRTLRTSTGLEYGSVDSSGKRLVNEFDSAGREI